MFLDILIKEQNKPCLMKVDIFELQDPAITKISKLQNSVISSSP